MGDSADLSFPMSDPSAQHKAHVDELVADHSVALWHVLEARSSVQVHLTADNIGREPVADLDLIDRLLATGRVPGPWPCTPKVHPRQACSALSENTNGRCVTDAWPYDGQVESDRAKLCSWTLLALGAPGC